VASSRASAVVSAATAEQALGSAAKLWCHLGNETPEFCVLLLLLLLLPLLLLLLLLGGSHLVKMLSLQLPPVSTHLK
jgi:hypothetical protein